MILGYANYNDSKYPFVYENGILYLLPPTEFEWNKEKSNLIKSLSQFSKRNVIHEWICNEYISGVTNTGKGISFITKGSNSNNNGFIQFDIRVIYEYTQEDEDSGMIHGLTVLADEINYFHHPSSAYTTQIQLDKDFTDVTIQAGHQYNTVVDCGNYKYEDVTIKLEVSSYSEYTNQSESPLSVKSQIYLEFDKFIKLDNAIDIICHLESFLMFICYRKNINLNTINVIRLNDNNLRSKKGNIYFISDELCETSNKRLKQILSLVLLEEKICGIFQDIADGKVYLQHMCKNIDDKNSYNVSRMILIFAAFERVYNNSYSTKPIRSEEYLKVKSEVAELLEKYEVTCPNRKTRKYVQRYKQMIETNDSSLGDRIKQKTKENVNILDVFLKYHYSNVDDELFDSIAQRMNVFRNNIAHGNLDFSIEPIHLADIKMIEILIYVMQLKDNNLQTRSIKKCICELFGYRIHIED